MTDIKKIDRPDLDRLLASPGEKYEPFGLFLCPDDVGNAVIWTAVDNSTGEAWTEEFGGRNTAVKWLHGYAVKNIYGEMVNR